MDSYKPSPALDYQEFMRSTVEWLRAQGYELLPLEYTIMPHVLVLPRGHTWHMRSDTQRLTALRDKRDILTSMLHEVEERIVELEDKLERDNVAVMDR